MKFKVGNRVEHEFYGKGTVIGFSVLSTPLVEFDNPGLSLHDGNGVEKNGTRGKDGHCWFTGRIKPIESQTIVIYPKGLETIALLKEGKKVIKQANAKCNPTDEFDFNVGAKLAFRRLMGEDTILVVNPNEPALPTFDWEGFKQGKFAVHCDTEEKAKAFLKECDEQGIKWNDDKQASSETNFGFYKGEICYSTYEMRENCIGFSSIGYYEGEGLDIVSYTPSNTIREVHRPAKVGEWIRVTSDYGHRNGVGIFKVTGLGPNNDGWVYVNGQTRNIIRIDQYVVLENYQPKETTKTLADFTDKELINELSRRWEDRA